MRISHLSSLFFQTFDCIAIMAGTLSMLLLAVAFKSANPFKSPCIIAPWNNMMSSSGSNPSCDIEWQEKNGTLRIIATDSKREFDTVIDYVSRVLCNSTASHCGITTGGSCSEVIGVMGDLDLKTASIIHTLASRANLSITLVSAVAPSTFLPTTNLVLPNLLHMNPLTHYVEALAAFLDHLNWTRIGLISDNTDYYEFTAELIQQKLLENPERRIIPFEKMSESNNKNQDNSDHQGI